MSKALKKVKKVGRPSKIDDKTIAKLKSILKVGGSIKEACAYALIDQATYYRNLNTKKDFANDMESARVFVGIMAKKNIKKAIVKDKDLEASKWHLEKTQYNTKEQIGVNIDNEGVKLIVTRSG